MYIILYNLIFLYTLYIQYDYVIEHFVKKKLLSKLFS